MKKAALIVAIAVVGFALFADPVGLGDGAQTPGGWLKDGAVAVITFVRSAFS